MSSYKESQISGSNWTRGMFFQVYNPYVSDVSSIPDMSMYPPGAFPEGVPYFTFGEEIICVLDSGHIIKQIVNNNNPAEFIREAITPDTINTEFPILDANGNETGNTMTYLEVKNILSSLYIFSAKRRDERIEKMKIENENFLRQQINDNPTT